MRDTARFPCLAARHWQERWTRAQLVQAAIRPSDLPIGAIAQNAMARMKLECRTAQYAITAVAADATR